MIELRECIEKLAGDDEADRIYAAEDIGFSNQPEGVQPLLARLPQEPSRAVREAIFAALLQIEDDAVIEGSVGLLDSEDSFLRNQAVEVLRARGAKAIPYLDRAFREGNNDRRKFVIDILAKLGDADTSGIYEQALIDTDLNVVITAVENLGARRKAAFREQIEALIAPEAHPMLLSASIEALAQVGEAGSVNAVRDRLGGAARIPGYLRPSYLKLLGAKGCPDDIGEVACLIGIDGLEKHALNALTSLRSRYRGLELPPNMAEPLEKIAFSGGSILLAYEAIRSMAGLLHLQPVFDFVYRSLEHPEKAVRIAAIQAMREAGLSGAENILRERLSRETDEEVLQALTR
jgi:HEAT repeat protein